MTDGWSAFGGPIQGLSSRRTGFAFDGNDIGFGDRDLFTGVSESDHPLFDEYSSSFRIPLSSYAKLANKGNVQAAAAYQESLGLFRDAQRRYSEARSEGVNDRVATSCLRIADRVGSLLSKDLLTTTEPYKDRLSSYLARQAKQRGYLPDTLIGEEDELDRRFRSSYKSYRQASKSSGSRELTDIDGILSTVPGYEHDLSLAVREALSRYESSNGLYTVLDRGETLDEAARLLDRIHGNSKLNARYGGDYDAVIGMAAKRVLQGDKTANVIDLIDGDLATIQNGFVTYSGTTAGDASYGFEVKDRSGRVFTTALAPCVQGVLIDQAIEDRINGVDRFSNKAALKDKFVDRLSRLYSRAGLGVADQTKRLVYGTVADELVRMAGEGNVNLTSLADLWLKDPGFIPQFPEIKTIDWGKVGDFGEQVIEKWIGGRPNVDARNAGPVYNFASGAWNRVKNAVTGGTEPVTHEGLVKEDAKFRDLEYLRKNIRNEFSAYLKSSGLDKKELIHNKDTLNAYADRMADLVYYANTEGDKSVAGSGDRKGYADGARTMLAGLTLVQNLRDIGFDIPQFEYAASYILPGKTDGDKGYRYRDARLSFDNAFGGVYGYLKNYLRGVNPQTLTDDASFIRYQAALSYKEGIDALRAAMNGSVKDEKEIRDRKQFAADRLGVRLGGISGYNQMPVSATGIPVVRAAWEARTALRSRQSRELQDPSMLPARQMLDRLLADGFSDKVNPVQDRRVREMAVSLMDKYGDGFQGGSELYGAWLNRVQQAVSAAVQDLGVFQPRHSEDGASYLGWNPLAPLLGNTELEAAVTKKIRPTLFKVKGLSEDAKARRQKAVEMMSASRTMGNLMAREQAGE